MFGVTLQRGQLSIFQCVSALAAANWRFICVLCVLVMSALFLAYCQDYL